MQTIITKYLAPTNTRGSRIKVTSWMGSKTYSYDYAAACAHTSAFEQYLGMINAEMAEKYPANLQIEGGWFKPVANASLPDGTGYAFIIK